MGGGNAGLVAAMRLSVKGRHRVAVVEAGGFYEADAGNVTVIPAYESEFLDVPATIDWKLMTAPQSVSRGISSTRHQTCITHTRTTATRR